MEKYVGKVKGALGKVYHMIKPPTPGNYVEIDRQTYNQIRDEATSSRRERAGIVYGKEEDGTYKVWGMERLDADTLNQPEKPNLWQRIAGVGGEFASDKMDSYVGKKEHVAGFYHTHPSSDPMLSPADKKEFKKMEDYDNLKEPSKLQIVPRKRGAGILPIWGKAKPMFFLRDEDGRYKRAKARIKE